MQIIDLMKEAETSNKVHFSLEFFPPKTSEGVDNLILRIERMGKLDPLFVDVTWAAGGESSDLTLAICKSVHKVR
jgi:methylenetetrahydrofolate reductase (NADPH)